MGSADMRFSNLQHRSFVITILILALASLQFLSCTKEKRNQDNSNSVTNPPGAATLSSLQTDIFTLGCATSGCHDNRATPAGNLNMSSLTQTYASIVNRNSVQATNLKLVLPSNSEASYFVNKLLGTHVAVGGSGVRMPQYAASLSSADIDRVVTWINNGAELN